MQELKAASKLTTFKNNCHKVKFGIIDTKSQKRHINFTADNKLHTLKLNDTF